jgi:hypothetical protein
VEFGTMYALDNEEEKNHEIGRDETRSYQNLVPQKCDLKRDLLVSSATLGNTV